MQESAKKAITEIIQSQSKILGNLVAIQGANTIKGLQVSQNGDIIQIPDDAIDTLQKLTAWYVTLGGDVVKKPIDTIISKYNISLDLT